MDDDAFKQFEIRLSSYVGTLQRLGVEKNASLINQSGRKVSRLNRSQVSYMLIVGFPLFIVSFVLHMSYPFQITRTLSLKVVKRVDFMGSVAMALGLLVFTIFGTLETYYCPSSVFKNWWITAGFFLVWPSLGLLAYGYLAEWVKLREAYRWVRVGTKRLSILRQLKKDKKALLAYLDECAQAL